MLYTPRKKKGRFLIGNGLFLGSGDWTRKKKAETKTPFPERKWGFFIEFRSIFKLI
jgi:hypothetical protein